MLSATTFVSYREEFKPVGNMTDLQTSWPSQILLANEEALKAEKSE